MVYLLALHLLLSGIVGGVAVYDGAKEVPIGCTLTCTDRGLYTLVITAGTQRGSLSHLGP